MRVLLDTHAFVRFELEDPQLSEIGRGTIADASNDVLVSAATAYEIGLKASLGRLTLPEPAETYVPSRIALEGFEPLPIDVRHAARAAALPGIHGDPFDRLLVAQAQIEGIPIVTADPAIARYDVETIW
jgi:PIN domain nuclease of toxin-antitoxin system